MASDQAYRKEYVLVSSTDRTGNSRSTTDFTVRLSKPIHKVVKTDLVQAIIDYRIANVTAPGNMFTIEEGQVSRELTLEDGIYTPNVLKESLETLLGPDYTVNISADNVLSIEYMVPTEEAIQTARTHRLIVSNATMRQVLGLRSSPVTPTYAQTDGEFGSYRWAFSQPVRLSQVSPYLLIQSQNLGTDIRTAKDQGYWRLLLNDPVNSLITMSNNRVDTYQESPRTLQEIDVRLVFPDGTVVNNRTGSLTLLIEVVRLE